MGASAGKEIGDEGESAGISTIKTGKNPDDDEDFNWRDYGEQGGGGKREGNIFQQQQAVDKLWMIDQVEQNLLHQKHKRLHARQELGTSVGGSGDTVSDVVPPGVSDVLSSIPITAPNPDPSSLSVVLPSQPLVPSLSTDIMSILPIGNGPQTFLSSTPPPSPVQTSSGEIITPTTSSTSTPQSQSPTISGPVTTITSSGPIFNNGTLLSTTKVTTTIDGTVFVYPSQVNTASNSSSRSSRPPISRTSFSSNSTTASVISSLSLQSGVTPTDVIGGVGGGPVPTTDLVSPPSSTNSTTGSSSPPVSPKLLGGVLGGIAGIAFVLVAILYLVRQHKRKAAASARDDAGYGGPLGSSSGNQMAEGSSVTTPFALAGVFFARHSRASRVSESSETPTVPSETGFYKISGRKLPPVLGGPRPVYGSTRSAGGSSYNHDEDTGGWAGGSGTVASTPSVAGPSRYSSIASASPTTPSAPMSLVTPALIPVSASHPHMGSSMAPPPPRIQEEAAESDTESTHQPPRPLPIPRQLSAISVGSAGKDGVGRSLPSHDGSRASRFTEDIV